MTLAPVAAKVDSKVPDQNGHFSVEQNFQCQAGICSFNGLHFITLGIKEHDKYGTDTITKHFGASN